MGEEVEINNPSEPELNNVSFFNSTVNFVTRKCNFISEFKINYSFLLINLISVL